MVSKTQQQQATQILQVSTSTNLYTKFRTRECQASSKHYVYEILLLSRIMQVSGGEMPANEFMRRGLHCS